MKERIMNDCRHKEEHKKGTARLMPKRKITRKEQEDQAKKKNYRKGTGRLVPKRKICKK